jgi:hypothetical protein
MWMIVLADAEAAILTASLGAGDVCKFVADAFVDLGGNQTTTQVQGVAAADTSASVPTVSSATCVDATQNVLTVGNLTMTAVAKGSGGNASGAKGNTYGLTVTNSRGMLQPTISIDDTLKTITVVADTGYHTAADITARMLTLGNGGSWVASGAGALSATVIPKRAITGTSNCTLKLATAEPVTTATAGVSIGVGGLIAGYITNTAATSSVAWATADTDATTMTNLSAFTFTTAVIGSGSISVLATADGMLDMESNKMITPVTFTITG